MAELMEVQGATLIYTNSRSDPLLFKDSPFAVKRVSLAMHRLGSQAVKAHVQASTLRASTQHAILQHVLLWLQP